MFQSIKYLNYKYNNKNKLYHYSYEITDSDFISNSSVVLAPIRAVRLWECLLASGAGAVIKEYESRKCAHQEIISNLFLLNMFLLKENWYSNINQILQYQNKYLTKEYYPKINFHEKYYKDLVKYTKKMIALL